MPTKQCAGEEDVQKRDHSGRAAWDPDFQKGVWLLHPSRKQRGWLDPVHADVTQLIGRRTIMKEQRRSSPQLGDSLMAIHLLVAIAGAVIVLSRALGVAGCEGRCNYPVLETSTQGFWIVDAIILVLTAGTYFLMRSRLRLAWTVPAAGLILTLVALLMANVAIGDALIVG